MTFDLTPDVARPPCVPPQQRPGTVALLNTLDRRHPAGFSLGIYNCRAIRGSKRALSRHAVSAALDWRPGAAVGSPEFVAEGDAIAAALVAAARFLGIQRIIWNRRVWTEARGWQRYTGSAGPHLDHLHIELTDEAARTLTMTAIAAAYGVKAPRKDPDMPNPTDVTGACTIAGKGGPCVLKLQRQGGVITDGEPTLPLVGSMLSRGMATDLARSSRVFTAIATLDHATGEFAISDNEGRVYRFTRALGKRLAKAE